MHVEAQSPHLSTSVRELVLISLDMQVGQHVQTAIRPWSSPLRHACGHFASELQQMHLPASVLLEALTSFCQHHYHNRQDVH